MKKAANILLKVSKILGIIAIAALAIYAVIALIGGIAAFTATIGGTEEEAAAGIAALGVAIGTVIALLVYDACQIVALVLVCKASKGLANAHCKADAKKPGIMAIVAGALGTGLAIVAGIFMLVMNDSYYDNTVVDNQQ